MTKFLVTEIQTWNTGAVQNPTWAYENEQSALAKYYSVLSAAAVSTLPVHACAMLTNEGFLLKHECFKHAQPEPVPEPEEDIPEA